MKQRVYFGFQPDKLHYFHPTTGLNVLLKEDNFSIRIKIVMNGCNDIKVELKKLWKNTEKLKR